MPFACIHVPDFPVEAILRAEPDLRLRPVAVLEGKPPLEKILVVNEEAQDAGLAQGMTKLQAELCDGVVLRERSEMQESAAHQALLDCAQSFSPRVEDFAADTLLLDLSGLEKLFGSLPKIARDISRRACEMGLHVNVAVASSLEAALIAAHGFNSVTVLPEGKEAEILGSLPVEVLFTCGDARYSDPTLSQKTRQGWGNRDFANAEEFLEIFRRWGVRKIRDLAALPEIELTERLGQAGLELQRKARGVGSRNLVASDPPLVFEEAMELEYPIVLLEPLAFVLNRMLEQLCLRLRGRSMAAQELKLELTLEDSFRDRSGYLKDQTPKDTKSHEGKQWNIFQRIIRLPVPMIDPKIFLKLLQLDLNANPPGAPITKVYLRIEPAKPRASQNGFFIPSSPEPEKLELTLARINGIVGHGRAGSPVLLDAHRRDAFEMQHFSPTQPGSWGEARLVGANGNAHKALAKLAAREHSTLDHITDTLVTALRIFRPAIDVRITYSKGQLSHIRSLKGRQISGEILWSAGPWRSSGDWWEQDAWMRDEWDIAVEETAGIVLYRLVHDLISGRWMLEGSYD